MYLEHFTTLQQEHTPTLQTLQEQRELITQLEADLSKVQPFLSLKGEGLEGGVNASAEIISEALRGVEGEGTKVNAGAGDVMGGASSLLPIVSSQRERFKQRAVELEAVSVCVGCVPITQA